MRRTARRPLRRLALPALPAFFLTGCVDRPVSRVDPTGSHVEQFTVPTIAERDVDILFVIDSSESMREEHASLRSNFGALLARLDDIPGGLPNIHLGVVSSDLGTAPYAVNSQCRADGGDGGLLHGAACAALAGNPFIEDVLDADGNRRRNYTGTLEDAFGCAADVGTSGCGFEQHLAAMQRALSPGTNPGFVRPEAALAVVILADEDDCSTADPALYNPSSPALGPLPISDFRCHAHGIVCDDDPDPAAPGEREGCRPAPDSAYLADVQRFVDFLVDLKGGDADKVVVAGVIGDPAQVEIGRDRNGNPAVLATCPAGGLGASEPGIRLDVFLRGFAHSSISTLCASDLEAALAEIGQVIGEWQGSTCLASPVADRNGVADDGVQPECSLVEVVGPSRQVLPACAAAGVARPCWRIVVDAGCAATQQKVEIDRGGAAPPDGGTIEIQCVVE